MASAAVRGLCSPGVAGPQPPAAHLSRDRRHRRRISPRTATAHPSGQVQPRQARPQSHQAHERNHLEPRHPVSLSFPKVVRGWHLRSWKAVPPVKPGTKPRPDTAARKNSDGLTQAQKANLPGPWATGQGRSARGEPPLANLVPFIIDRQILVDDALAHCLDPVQPRIALVAGLEARRNVGSQRELKTL